MSLPLHRATRKPRASLRALVVERTSFVPRGDYDLGSDEVSEIIAIFMVPKDFNQYRDTRGKKDDAWLASMQRRFRRIEPASKDSVTIYDWGKDEDGDDQS